MLLRLQIIATGEFLVLSPDGTLPMELNTTIFNDDADLLGSKSYQVTLPLEPNRAIIRNAHLILTNPALRTLRVRAWLNNSPWLVGNFTFTYEAPNINANFFVDLSLYVNLLKTLTLDQLTDNAHQLHFDSIDAFKAYMVSTTTAAPGEMPMVFYPIKNTAAYKTIDPASYSTYPDIAFPVNPYINAWQMNIGGVGSFLLDTDPGHVSQTQMPAFYLAYILKRIAAFLNLTPVGTVLDDPDFNRIVIQTMIPNIIFGVIADFPYYMPAILLTDFIKAVRKEQGLIIDINEIDGTMLIESLSNLEDTAEIIDLRPYQVANTIRETSEAPAAITITQGADDKDLAYSDSEKTNLPVLTIGNLSTAQQQTDITMLSVTTKMLTELSPVATFPATSNWRIPMMQQPIRGATPLDQISSVAVADERSFKLRLLYYHGVVPDDSGLYRYPYASADNLDKDGASLTSFSLALNASSSAFLAIRHRYNYMFNSKPLEQTFILPPKVLLSIKANCRILMSDHNLAPVYCIWAQQALDVGYNQQLLVKSTLWPKILPANTSEITNNAPPPPVIPPDNGLVYIRLEQRNVTAFHTLVPPPERDGHRCDIWVSFWADAPGTVPKDITGLPVRLSCSLVIDLDPPSVTILNYTATSVAGALELYPSAPLDVTTFSEDGVHNSNTTYTLLPSDLYTIIV
jgi:hypothetical protein